MMRRLSHLQIIALGYFLIVLTGAVLLTLPIASKGEPVGFFDALFTTTSASCVTGLIVRDTATTWSGFGQAVILILIQVGGLGFMTVASLFFRLMRRKAGLRERELMVEGLNVNHVGGIMGLTRRILIGTALFEGVGALLLAIRFIPMLGVGRGIWYSIFHAVTAFCNAGFDLMGAVSGPYSSLSAFTEDWLVLGVLTLLILIGGIGFLVWDDLLAHKGHWRRYTLHTKLALSVTLGLTAAGTVLFLLTERAGRGDLSLSHQILNALFDSVTPRTAGFNAADTAGLSDPGKLVTMLLMFIGGSPGSTAGGIKTTTLAVLAVQTVSQMRHSQTTSVFRREISGDILRKAAAVVFVNATLGIGGAFILCAAQPELALTDALFETISAISTTGMTVGITRMLCPLSRAVIIFLMYCGRVGSVSFALALLEKRARPPVTYPYESLTVG